MQEYDLIVIGSGAGMNVAADAVGQGMHVAVVDHGPMGGTCLNNGCIPSKILLYPADVVRALSDASQIGVEGRITNIDFSLIMERARSFVEEGRQEMIEGIKATEELTWHKETGHFVDDYELAVGDERITAPRIVIASGSRPWIPDINGLQEAGYIDNITLLELEAPPRSLLVIGGGYIACEYAHFFSALGTEVTIIGRNPQLLKAEEPEISAVVQGRLGRFVDIHTNYEVIAAHKGRRKKTVVARHRETREEREFQAHEILLAAGRRSNADLLKPENTGVQTDDHGWIKVNSHLETSKHNIWALGDALGRYMFRHTANAEASIVSNNIFAEEKIEMDYHAVPHAVFGYPQVGAVGLTEAQVKAMEYQYLVGRAHYDDVTKGYAMGETVSMVKVLVELETRRILGCHIVGPEAAILVQQITYLMNAGHEDYFPLADAQVIHPALSEVIISAFANLRLPEHLEHLYEHAHHHHHHDHDHSDHDDHDRSEAEETAADESE